jgi:hypothetical protein
MEVEGRRRAGGKVEVVFVRADEGEADAMGGAAGTVTQDPLFSQGDDRDQDDFYLIRHGICNLAGIGYGER